MDSNYLYGYLIGPSHNDLKKQDKTKTEQNIDSSNATTDRDNTEKDQDSIQKEQPLDSDSSVKEGSNLNIQNKSANKELTVIEEDSKNKLTKEEKSKENIKQNDKKAPKKISPTPAHKVISSDTKDSRRIGGFLFWLAVWTLFVFIAYVTINEFSKNSSVKQSQPKQIDDNIDSDLAPIESLKPQVSDEKIEEDKANIEPIVITKSYKLPKGQYLEELLSYGDIDHINSNDVKRLQRFLKKMGYKVKVNGVFNISTKKALRRFQSRHGLKADAIVGKETRDLINNMIRESYE